jgi:hypothetical protein
MPDPKMEAQSLRMRLLILWVALTASVVGYGVVAYVIDVSREGLSPAPDVHGTVRPIFYVMAIVCLSAALLLENPLLGRARRRGAGAASSDSPDRPASLASLGGVFQLTFIVGMVLVEITAALGLVLYLLGEPLTEFLKFGGVALVFDLLWMLPKAFGYPKELEKS